MRDNAFGCAIVFGVVALVAILLAGAPIIDASGLAWDNSGQLARIASEERVELARLDQRDADSARWHATVHFFVLVLGGAVVVVAGVAGVTVAMAHGFGAWERVQERRTAAAQMTALAIWREAAPIMAQRPGSHVDCVDGEWCVIDDARQELVRVSR